MKLSRSHLLSLLSEACELEHALACSYLFAAFSLKRGQADELTWQQEQTVRRWAGQVYFVASQEMLHLAQVWNVLSAIGGTPYFGRARFPQAKGYLPIDADLTLEPYNVATLERFLRWEAPETVRATSFPARKDDSPYKTVGELYCRVAEAIRAFPERDLFIGTPALQVGPDLADFPNLIRVVDRESALAAIEQIKNQGEGRPAERLAQADPNRLPQDSHFGIFGVLKDEFVSATFAPAHDVGPNPSLAVAASTSYVTEPAARAAMRFFDDVYATMLQLLGWVFGPADPSSSWTRGVARGAIAAMPIVLKPLGEALATLPSGAGTQKAGAPFSAFRHVPLPPDKVVAQRLVKERINELELRGQTLVRTHAQLAEPLGWLPDRLAAVSEMLSAGR